MRHQISARVLARSHCYRVHHACRPRLVNVPCSPRLLFFFSHQSVLWQLLVFSAMEPSRMKRIDQVYAKWQQKGARRDRFESSRSSSCSSNNNNNTYSRRHTPRPPATTRPAKYRRRLQHKEQRAVSVQPWVYVISSH